MKVFALQSIDGSISSISETREVLENYLATNPMYASMCEIAEIEYNDTPLTEVGEATKAKLLQYMIDSGMRNFHASLGPKFYEMSADERMQFMWDIFQDLKEASDFSFNDSQNLDGNLEVTNIAPQSKREQIDLKDHLNDDGTLNAESLRTRL